MVDPHGDNDNDSFTVYVRQLPTESPSAGPPRPQPRPTGPILPATGPPGHLEGLVGIGIAEVVLGMVLLMPPRRRA
jgi:hypothetical protein